MNNFWRVCPPNEPEIEQMLDQSSLVAPPELFGKLRPKHGVVLAGWDEPNLVGNVVAFGVVQSVDIPQASAKIAWRSANVTLKPNSAGRQFWRKKAFFKFAKDVSIRYMLDDLFSEHFPELDSMEFSGITGNVRPAGQRQYQKIPGFVYLIESQHGYKIGKTVNLKSRISLFSVKLPFPIKLINYAWFEDYSRAERDFHTQFAAKRLEGEWFNLDDEDIRVIKRTGKQVPVEGF